MSTEGRSYHEPWEKALSKIVTPFDEFLHGETTSGVTLMACTVVALLLANSFLSVTYEHLLHTPVALTLGSMSLELTLHHWINDGLMALFFFLVGLEIKREVLVGELSELRQAALPIIAAIGGMVVPATVYALINFGGPGASGWGIPMATDIAFAVGVMVLLGSRIPKALFTFLVALAIVDDLGAVLVIAVFYTADLDLMALGAAAALVALLVMMSLGGVRSTWPYALVGTLLWLAMLKSGVHATLAGVLTALTIPARSKYSPGRFSFLMRDLLDRFDAARRRSPATPLRSSEMRAVLQTLQGGVRSVETPLQRMEHSMHIPVAFIILPLFALANAGIPFHLDQLGAALGNPVTLGVMLGLTVGKFVGITGAALLAVHMGIGQLPKGANVQHMIGVGMLGGIGFTMSIFIAELAFRGQAEELLMAKTGILFASVAIGLAGYLWLLLGTRPAPTQKKRYEEQSEASPS